MRGLQIAGASIAIACACLATADANAQAPLPDPSSTDFIVPGERDETRGVAEFGRSLFVRETAGSYAWRSVPQDDDPQTVTLSTDLIHALHVLRTEGVGAPIRARSQTLQGVFEQDVVTGEYRLVRSELGLFSKRLWLIHEPARTEREDGSISVRLRFSW